MSGTRDRPQRRDESKGAPNEASVGRSTEAEVVPDAHRAGEAAEGKPRDLASDATDRTAVEKSRGDVRPS